MPMISSGSTTIVAVNGSAAAACAQVLAAETGAPLRLVDAADGAWLEDDGQLCFVSLADALGDRTLVAALERTAKHNRRARWGAPQACCFVTADDLPALERYVARLIDASRAAPRALRFDLIASDAATSLRRTLRLAGEPRAEIGDVPSAEVAALIASADGVLALHGHGGDACAQAGGVTVLCGLRRGSELRSYGGRLACLDEQVPCPRGPAPLPLSSLRAPHVMQASCSSARMRDASIASTFNLLYSYLDGGGLSYIGTATGGGRPECCLLYLAAMADGCTLGECVTLVNWFLEEARLAHAVYLGIGLPELQTAPRRDSAVVLEPHDGAWCADFGDRHFATTTTRDPVLLAWAEAGRLSLSITAEDDAEILWFARLEDDHLRLFFFSFPGALGTARIRPYDGGGLTETLRSRLTAIERWTAYHRVLDGTAASGVTAGQAAYQHYRHTLPALLDRLSFDGRIDATIEPIGASISATAGLLRDMLLLELGTKLGGAFWMTNELMPEQVFLRADRARCPACGGCSFIRRMSNRLSEEHRSVNVCMCCGIMDDLRDGSALREVRVACPDPVPRGTTLEVTVEIHSPVEGREVVAISTISGPYSPKLEAQTQSARVEDGVARLRFSFDLPPTMPLHEFRWKSIVTDEEDIAFVTRCMFVTAGPP